MIIFAKNMFKVDHLKIILKSECEMKDLDSHYQFKLVENPLATHFKLDQSIIPNLDKDKDFITKVPYSSIVGSPIIYLMVYTRLDLGHVVSVVNKFMTNRRRAD